MLCMYRHWNLHGTEVCLLSWSVSYTSSYMYIPRCYLYAQTGPQLIFTCHTIYSSYSQCVCHFIRYTVYHMHYTIHNTLHILYMSMHIHITYTYTISYTIYCVILYMIYILYHILYTHILYHILYYTIYTDGRGRPDLPRISHYPTRPTQSATGRL